MHLLSGSFPHDGFGAGGQWWYVAYFTADGCSVPDARRVQLALNESRWTA
ncbi:hypothetical protein [Streptomyces armeniacus]|nr:hypothetical protein [Streptomyces armeniacus]